MLISSKVIGKIFGKDKDKDTVRYALYIACLGCGNICRETLTFFDEIGVDFFKVFITNYMHLGLVHKYCCVCSKITGYECNLCQRRVGK